MKIAFFLCFLSGSIVAQKMMTFSDIMIQEKGMMSIFGEHEFSESITGNDVNRIYTEKEGEKGFVGFVNQSSWVGAADVQFINGFVKVFHSNKFTFPIGDGDKYRPVSTSGSDGMAAAYFDENPENVADINSQSVSKLLESGYWNIESDVASQITLTWDLSDNLQSLALNNQNSVSIMGLQNGVWEVVPSTIDERSLDFLKFGGKVSSVESDLIKGSITTDESVVASNYEFFTIGILQPDLVDNGSEVNFHMFPNPSLVSSQVRIEYQLGESESGVLRVFNSNNQLVSKMNLTQKIGTVELPEIRTIGSYFVSVTDNKGNMEYKKLILVRY